MGSPVRLKLHYDYFSITGEIDKRIMYAEHNNNSDCITFYDSAGNEIIILSVEEFEAMEKLFHIHEDTEGLDKHTFEQLIKKQSCQ